MVLQMIGKKIDREKGMEGDRLVASEWPKYGRLPVPVFSVRFSWKYTAEREKTK